MTGEWYFEERNNILLGPKRTHRNNDYSSYAAKVYNLKPVRHSNSFSRSSNSHISPAGTCYPLPSPRPLNSADLTHRDKRRATAKASKSIAMCKLIWYWYGCGHSAGVAAGRDICKRARQGCNCKIRYKPELMSHWCGDCASILQRGRERMSTKCEAWWRVEDNLAEPLISSREYRGVSMVTKLMVKILSVWS